MAQRIVPPAPDDIIYNLQLTSRDLKLLRIALYFSITVGEQKIVEAARLESSKTHVDKLEKDVKDMGQLTQFFAQVLYKGE